MRYPSRALRFAIAINVGLGLVRLTEPADRYLSAGYTSAKQAMPIRWWGMLFLACGVALIAAHTYDMVLRWTALLVAAPWVLWAALSAFSAHASHHGDVCRTVQVVGGCHYAVSYGGAGLYLFVAGIHGLIFFRRLG